ncbi:MAG: DUF1572 family protein [Planctomycetota bacterium]
MNDAWLTAARETLAGYRRMIDAVLEQTDDEVLVRRPRPGMNSIAVILRHLGGNLQSRFTDFLTTDGEKPTRDRDAEMQDWPGSRAELMAWFDTGWSCFTETLEALGPADVDRTVWIRGVDHTIPDAIDRALTHVSYHIGQVMLLARLLRESDDGWNWLTVAPGESRAFNEETWGTAASRSVLGAQPKAHA